MYFVFLSLCVPDGMKVMGWGLKQYFAYAVKESWPFDKFKTDYLAGYFFLTHPVDFEVRQNWINIALIVFRQLKVF